MKLLELFDTETELNVILDNTERVEIEGAKLSPGTRLKFIAYKHPRTLGEYCVVFGSQTLDRALSFKLLSDGNALKTFAWVVRCMRWLVKEKAPSVISFDATDKDDGSNDRANLYLKVAKRELAKVPGYKLVTHNRNDAIEFRLVKASQQP